MTNANRTGSALALAKVVLVGLAASLLSLSASQAQSDPSEWWKMHARVENAAGEFVGELSMIYQTPPDGTVTGRILFEDTSHRLWVIRTVHMGDAIGTTVSFELLSTNEVLGWEFDAGPMVDVTLNGASMTFDAEETEDPLVVQEAADLLAQSSVQFQDALRDLIQIGQKYISKVDILTRAMSVLFYPNHAFDTERVAVNVTVDTIRPFDPATDPPNAFEAQFGSHYDQ